MDFASAQQLVQGTDGPDTHVDVPVEHLDYNYVERCTDINELRRILAILKSGKEGKYEHLESTVEERMLALMPADQRSKWIAMNRDPSWHEKRQAADDVAKWLHTLPTSTGESAQPRQVSVAKSAKPVRGSRPDYAPMPVASAPNSEAQPLKRDSKAEPFSEYYNKWDKFDVDGALKIAEQEEAAKEAERQAAIAKAEAEEAARRKARADQLRQAGLPVDPETLSRGDRDAAAGREKEKGNECFKAGEWEDALAFYTRAIAYAGNDKSAAVLYGNRAQARIKLKQWASCEDDCTAALAWEPRNVKCLLRRATARISRGKYREAVLDCKAVTATEKDAAMLSQATKLIIEAREKGRSAGVDVDAAQEEEDQGGGQPRQQQAAPAPAAAAAARRIAIEEEDDEEEDGVGQQPLQQQQPQPGVSSNSAPPPKPTARRMVIEEDDSSDEEEPRSATRAGRALPPPLTSRQVSAASSTPAAPSSSSTVAPSAKRMIIQEADGDDRSDTKGDGNLKPTSVAAAVKTVSRAAPPPAVPAAQVPASPAPAAATTVKAAVAANGSSTAAAVDAKSQADKEKEAGSRLFQQGQYGDAVAAYTRSLALCPGVVGVLTNRAAARLKLQQWSSAALDCTDALKAAGVTQEQVDVMAGIELGAGQGGAASPSIAPDASATAVKALWRRAQANRENGHQEKALSDLAAALHLEPSNNKVKEELRELKLVLKTAKAGTAAATPAAATTPTPAATSSTPPSTASAVASQPAQPPVAPASPAPAAKPVPAASPSGTPTQQQPQQAGPGSPSPRKAADAVARAASAAAAALAKTAAARSSSLPPCPRTSFELEASVKSLRRDPATLLAYARQIPGQHLASIIKTPADTDMVTYLLAGLRKAIATSAAPASSSSSSLDDRTGEWLVSLLDGLRRSVGFDTVARMFLGDESDDAEALLDAALAAGIGADARKLAAEVRPYFRPR